MTKEYFMNKSGVITCGGWEYTSYDQSFTEEIYSEVEDHPEAMEALTIFYKKAIPNKRHFRYLITHQFLCCRYGMLDYETPDVDDHGRLHAEHVTCPIRTMCPMHQKVCSATRKNILTKTETNIMKALFNNQTRQQIADERGVELCTINKHIDNAHKKYNVNSLALFFAKAIKENLF